TAGVPGRDRSCLPVLLRADLRLRRPMVLLSPHQLAQPVHRVRLRPVRGLCHVLLPIPGGLLLLRGLLTTLPASTTTAVGRGARSPWPPAPPAQRGACEPLA